MSDERLTGAREKELFEAIVSQLEDPERTRLRRMLLALGVGVFVVGGLVVGIVARMGWPGVCAFWLTFVSGMAAAWSVLRRQSSVRWEPPPCGRFRRISAPRRRVPPDGES